ncbi:MAG: 16S rRNA (guanine(966)-N(2))-methyltransferase RsmD [Bacillota bacterium]
MIKVIGGEFRGRSLLSVPGETTRPPLAKVRGAVANILVEYIDGARVIDLFSGTGSYSIELLSRGASHATCIDKNPKAVEIIRKNLSTLGIESRARVIIGDALRIVRLLEKTEKPYSIALVAPPYFTGLDKGAMDILGTSPLVDPAGIVVLQQHRKEKHEESYGRLAINRTYMYGDTRVSTYLVMPNL